MKSVLFSSHKNLSLIGLLFLTTFFSTISWCMEGQEAVVTKEDLKCYAQGVYNAPDLIAHHRIKVVYEMIFAKSLEDLVDAMGAVAHLVPIMIKVPTSNGTALFFKSPADIRCFLLARIKKKNEEDIESASLPAHEVCLKFYRAYIKHAEKSDDFAEKALLCEFAVALLERNSAFI
jgi:hypothetical protein